MTTTAPAVVSSPKEEKSVEFIPFGASDKVRLTASMVRQFIAVPTKSGALPSERDCIKFIMLCRGKRANPFEGDVFMIGYDNWKDGRMVGATFSMVCGVELFLKRAEQSEQYDGRDSGVVVRIGDTITERSGSAVWPGEKLVGGWARVFRKDRTHPEYKVVNFETYNTGKSRWEKDPGGMIEKVALSQALRSAFPTALGGLYSQEEMTKLTESGEGLMIGDKSGIEMPKALPPAELPTSEPPPSEPPPAPAAPPEPALVPQKMLEKLLEENKVSFDDARDFLQIKGFVQDATAYASCAEMPTDLCVKFLSDKKAIGELVKKFGKK